MYYWQGLLHLTTDSVEKYLSSFWHCLQISILCPSFSVNVSSLFARIIPLNFLFQEMKHLNPLYTFACSMEVVIWGCRGSFRQGFLQYRLKMAPSLTAEHLSSSTPRGIGSQVGWGVSDLREQWRSHPHLLNACEKGAGMREHRVGTMHPAHFRRLNRSVRSSY